MLLRFRFEGELQVQVHFSVDTDAAVDDWDFQVDRSLHEFGEVLLKQFLHLGRDRKCAVDEESDVAGNRFTQRRDYAEFKFEFVAKSVSHL